jgi:cation diffusion facilitator family transporter
MSDQSPAIPPPSAADLARISRLKQRAAALSVLASVVLTLGKALAAWLSGSLALLSEALHGLIDIAATATTWFAIRAAEKPADADHHYGHGKVESLAALAECALLFALAGAVAWEAGNRLWTGAHLPVEVTPVVIGVLVAAILIDGTRWRALHIIARDTHSEALAADALHFASDLVSSALTLVGLVMVLVGYPYGDALAAFGVSLFIFVAATRLGARTVNTLLDGAPKGVSETIEATALTVPGVEGIDWVRLRSGGGRVIGEVGVKVARTMPLEKAAEVKAALAAALAAAAPHSELTITANPTQTEREDALERVMIIAARLAAPVHHIGFQVIGGVTCISLDMEVDSGMPLSRAHDLASQLEAAIRAEFGPATEVESHIEPLDMSRGPGANSEWSVVEAVGKALAAGAAEGGVLSDVHNVRVREGRGGLTVNFHCRAAPDLDIASVHAAVDAVERALRLSRTDIVRVVGHAEPLREAPARG